MPEWGYWSIFFVVSLGALTIATRLDSATRSAKTASGSGRRSNPGARISTPSPPRGPGRDASEPLSVQVPLER